MDWIGKTFLVTGASGGIGAAIVKALASRGCVVGALARRTDRLEALHDRLSGAEGRVIPLPADITQPLQVEAAVQQLVAGTGRLDGLLNNAGFLGDRVPFAEYPDHRLSRALEVNVTGTFYVTRAALPTLEQAPEAFVLNMSSYLGRHGMPNCLGYVASKFGLEGLTAALASERVGSPLIVASLAPGMVATEMLARYLGADSPGGTASRDELKAHATPAKAAAAFVALLDDLGAAHHGAQLELTDWM